MEKKVIKAQDYILPKIKQEQKTIQLTDINGNVFEAIFEVPSVKQIMLMEENGSEFTEINGSLYTKKSKVRKVEWILKNLLVMPVDLEIDYLTKLSAEELADTFR